MPFEQTVCLGAQLTSVAHVSVPAPFTVTHVLPEHCLCFGGCGQSLTLRHCCGPGPSIYIEHEPSGSQRLCVGQSWLVLHRLGPTPSTVMHWPWLQPRCVGYAHHLPMVSHSSGPVPVAVVQVLRVQTLCVGWGVAVGLGVAVGDGFGVGVAPIGMQIV